MCNLKILFIKMVLYIGIVMWIDVAWRVMEIIAYGQATPRIVDSIICAVFGWSVYKNLDIEVE